MPAKPPKILIVDDEPHIRTLLKATLGRAGYSVVEAAKAREALSAKSIDKPDLVLLDLGLPDRDGLELVAAMRAEPRSALIVVSAREQIEQKVAALDLGADDYVTKPLDTEELLARVRASLRQRLASESERQVVEPAQSRSISSHAPFAEAARTCTSRPRNGTCLPSSPSTLGGYSPMRACFARYGAQRMSGQTEYLRVAIRSLRQKLEETPSEPRLIINEPGVGYRLMAG